MPRKTSTSLVSKLASHTARDPARLLGDVIWWQLAGGEIDSENLARIWNSEMLPPEHLPEPPTAERAFRAALRSAQVGISDRLLRIAQDDADRLVVGIVAEHRQDADLHYQVEARVSLEHGTEALAADDPDHPIFHRIRERYQVCRRTCSVDDLRRAVVRTLEGLAAIQLRTHGGILFTPAPGAATVRRLQAAVGQIGDSRLFILPISDSAEGQATLTHVARRALEDDLEGLQAELKSFIESPPERESTLLRRLQQFEDLRARARLFSTVLQVRVDDLDKQIVTLEGVVNDMVTQRSNAAA